MNRRTFSHQPARHQNRRHRLTPRRDAVGIHRAPVAGIGQTDWDALMRLVLVLVLTGSAIAALRWALQ